MDETGLDRSGAAGDSEGSGIERSAADGNETGAAVAERNVVDGTGGDQTGL